MKFYSLFKLRVGNWHNNISILHNCHNCLKHEDCYNANVCLINTSSFEKNIKKPTISIL